jgi:hypothetical protein
MQAKSRPTAVSHDAQAPLLTTLYSRIYELHENFNGFVKSECNWTPHWYDFYLQHPEKCPAEDLELIVKIAGDLARDLQVLTARCKQTLENCKAAN